jgi:hypothetical protein
MDFPVDIRVGHCRFGASWQRRAVFGPQRLRLNFCVSDIRLGRGTADGGLNVF